MKEETMVAANQQLGVLGRCRRRQQPGSPSQGLAHSHAQDVTRGARECLVWSLTAEWGPAPPDLLRDQSAHKPL